MRVNIILACTECKRRNYSTRKNKKNTTGRLEMKKYCPWDKKHTLHRETREQYFRRGEYPSPLTVRRAVALTARAAVSKTASWGFESLLPCHFLSCGKHHGKEIRASRLQD